MSAKNIGKRVFSHPLGRILVGAAGGGALLVAFTQVAQALGFG
jgi:hypothetical protein